MSRVWVLALAFAALLAVWRAMPGMGLPLYDGLQLPPEAYRYLKPPANTVNSTKAPTSATYTIAAQDAQVDTPVIQTHEQPFQAAMVLGTDALKIPSGVTRITFSVAPIAPPRQPAHGTISGNVYRFSARGNTGASVSLRPQGIVTIQLRQPESTGQPVIEHFAGGTWVPVHTAHYVGTRIEYANAHTLGDFALISASAASSSGGSSSLLPLLLVGIPIIILLALGLLLIRLTRARSAPGEGEVTSG